MSQEVWGQLALTCLLAWSCWLQGWTQLDSYPGTERLRASSQGDSSQTGRLPLWQLRVLKKQGTNHLSPSRLDWESASHHFLHAPLVKAIPCPPGIKSKRKQKGPVDGRSVEEWGAFLILTYSALKHTLLEMLLGASPWLYPYKKVLVSLVQNCKLWNSFPLDLPLSEVTWLRQWIPLIQGRTFTPKRHEISNLFRSWVPRCRHTEEKKKKQQRQEWWCFEWLLGRKNITRLW